MAHRRTVDRFDGRILGAGTSSGVRLVVGDWADSPLGSFTDVMVATADDRRVLLAPTDAVADYVTSTYTFDEVVRCDVALTETGAKGARRWLVEAGPLRASLDLGSRTATGWLLAAVPGPLTRSRAFATLADPVARLVHPGVRTRGSAGNGRREYYGARDQHAVTHAAGTWRGRDLGRLGEVTPDPRFGFSSTPAQPSLTVVTTTVVRV
ncbi:hypothetical protein [Janibacter sp. DB-40]|uniref:hypothetical protein n=1 Tax=Janibacter sp. DB-40 TaxID=3028808 RepID=UPI0024051597|nr:hypothetical protein [Janibacter sp. DB-40]